MHYQKFIPVTELQPWVECFFEWKGEAEKELDVQSPPSSFSGIIFNFSDSYSAYQNDSTAAIVPKAFVCGLFTSNYHLVLKGKINMMGIVFKSTALHNLFNLRMSMLVNNRMDLHLLLNDQADKLIDSVSKPSDPKEKVNVLETFLLERLPEAKTRINIIDDAARYIDEKKGNVTVQEVADEFRISKRYLEKRFLEKVGVSPKFYARIKRFVALSNIVAHADKVDWQELVEKSGFHDQSHLAKEYLEFNKMNPSDYHKQHQEMTRFVDDLNLGLPKEKKPK